MNARKAHNTGRNHVANVRDYFASMGHDTAQSLIDQIVQSHESGGRAQMFAAPSMRIGAGFMNPMATAPYPPMGGGPPGPGPAYPPPNPNLNIGAGPPPGFRPPFPPPGGSASPNGPPPFSPNGAGGPPPGFRPPPQFNGGMPPFAPPQQQQQQQPPPQQQQPPQGLPQGFSAASAPPQGNPGIHPDRMRMMGGM